MTILAPSDRILQALAAGPLTLGAIHAVVRDFPADYVHAWLQALAGDQRVRCTSVPARGGARPRRPGEQGDYVLLWSRTDQGAPTAVPRPVSPPAARAPRRQHVGGHRIHLAPHTDDKPEPMEILARLAGPRGSLGRSTAPRGTSTVPLTPLDIAHAVATATDKLGAAMAMAISCQRPGEWPRVQELGRPRLLRHLHAQREFPDIVAGAHRFRARIALWDAFHGLIAPAARPRLSDAARAASMRRSEYRYMLDVATAILESAASTAAADAVRFLFSAAIEHVAGARFVSVSAAGQIRVWTADSAAQVQAAMQGSDVFVLDVCELLRDITTSRARRAGVLSLNTEP